MLAKSTVKLEAIFLAVNLVRSPIRIERKDSQWHLHCFSDGTTPYQLEVWIGDKLEDFVEMTPGIASESHLTVNDATGLGDIFNMTVVARSTQNFTPIISEGKMMAGVQISHLNISPSRDGVSFEAKMESQKILISNFEMDLFEIYGQPHNMPRTGDSSAGRSSTSVNRSQTSFFSATNGELPGYNRECVVCLSQRRDTLFLPCRHMCLCLPCAESLCLHSDKCPICRQGIFQLLLQLFAHYISWSYLEFRSMLSINDA